MRRSWLWWLGGGLLALWAYKAKASGKKGELSIHLTGFKSDAADPLLAAILTGNAACPGLPKITKLLRGPFVAGGVTEPGKAPQGLSAGYVFEAEWTHDVLGPIKDIARGCLERRLQAIVPGVTVTAERLS
jgi:hypothetical protein